VRSDGAHEAYIARRGVCTVTYATYTTQGTSWPAGAVPSRTSLDSGKTAADRVHFSAVIFSLGLTSISEDLRGNVGNDSRLMDGCVSCKAPAKGLWSASSAFGVFQSILTTRSLPAVVPHDLNLVTCCALTFAHWNLDMSSLRFAGHERGVDHDARSAHPAPPCTWPG
jgi:hypothetical protein